MQIDIGIEEAQRKEIAEGLSAASGRHLHFCT